MPGVKYTRNVSTSDYCPAQTKVVKDTGILVKNNFRTVLVQIGNGKVIKRHKKKHNVRKLNGHMLADPNTGNCKTTRGYL